MFLESGVVRDMHLGNQQLGILTNSALRSISSREVTLHRHVAHNLLAIKITTTNITTIFTTLTLPLHYTMIVQTSERDHRPMG